MSWEIKHKNNVVIASVGKIEYNDTWMGETYVSVSIESPSPIDFSIGDYLLYRGERFEINYDPGKIKTAPRFKKGDAFKYENVKFNSLADELTRCDFLDVVPNDNQLHFTGLPKFSFYGNVKNLAERIQANLDRAYGKDTWDVKVDKQFPDTTELNVSVDTIKVQGALEILVNDFKTYYTISGRTITIGAAGIPANHLFKYGKGNGLYEIEQNAEADQAIVTRLRAYGSTRNLPHRWYNSLTGADGKALIPDNMAVQYLMLPSFPYSTQDPYIDSPNIEALGVREGTIFFDGSGELEEIYPSIEGMTADELHAAGVDCNAEGRLDEITWAEQLTDNGVGEIEGDPMEGNATSIATPETFKIFIKDIGFDINDHLTTQPATVSFKSGKLGGREFEIVRATHHNNNKWYILELKRVYDEDIKLWFPYADYNAEAGDRFVLLYIRMPEVYVKAASQRLLKAAQDWLAKNDYSRSVYAPKIDEIFMARQHDAAMASGGTIKSLHDNLRAGMQLLFEDEDLKIDAAIFIDSLTIVEGDKAIPTYEVVLKEEKTVGRLDKMQNQIDSLAAGQGQGGGGYTAAQIRALIDAYGGTRFLSKVANDRTAYRLAVGDLFSAEKGAQFGGFVSGLAGAAVDAQGNAEFSSVIVRSFMQIYELIVNRQRTIEGDWLLAEGDTIESMQQLDNGRYLLQLKEDWPGYRTAQYEGNILRGVFNNITDKISGPGTTTINNATYYECWMRVESVNPEANTLEVQLYPDNEVPAGKNFPPQPMMKFARWGNAGAKPEQLRRQTVFYFSSTEGRIEKRYRVTKPICDIGNVAVTVGTLPEVLEQYHQLIKAGDDGIYAPKIVTQALIRLDHLGLPEPELIYRGQWSANADYFDGTVFAEYNQKYERSVVLYFGCKWLCCKTGTKVAPSWLTTDWVLYEGDPSLRLRWASSEDTVLVDNPQLTLAVIAEAYNRDVTTEQGVNWKWERYSERKGVQDKTADDDWNAANSTRGRNELTIGKDDMNYAFNSYPDVLRFTVTATLVDAQGQTVTRPEDGTPIAMSMEFDI